jgi:hypothetical protein
MPALVVALTIRFKEANGHDEGRVRAVRAERE